MSTTVTIDKARRMFHTELDEDIAQVRKVFLEIIEALSPESSPACMAELDRQIEEKRAECEAGFLKSLMEKSCG